MPIQERLVHAADEIVLVGDDPELDIAAGRRTGRHVFGVN